MGCDGRASLCDGLHTVLVAFSCVSLAPRNKPELFADTGACQAAVSPDALPGPARMNALFILVAGLVGSGHWES